MEKKASTTIPLSNSFNETVITTDPLNDSGIKQGAQLQLQTQTAEDAALIKAYIDYSDSKPASQKIRIVDEVPPQPVLKDMRHYRK